MNCLSRQNKLEMQSKESNQIRAEIEASLTRQQQKVLLHFQLHIHRCICYFYFFCIEYKLFGNGFILTIGVLFKIHISFIISLRLLRHELEVIVSEKFGDDYNQKNLKKSCLRQT